MQSDTSKLYNPNTFLKKQSQILAAFWQENKASIVVFLYRLNQASNASSNTSYKLVFRETEGFTIKKIGEVQDEKTEVYFEVFYVFLSTRSATNLRFLV